MAVRNNPFKPIIKKIPAPLRNKYFMVLVLFFAWMIFFDKHDVLTQWRLQQTINNLEEDKQYYIDNFRRASQDRLDIENNKAKFAREKYHLQKKNEDVFIMVEK